MSADSFFRMGASHQICQDYAIAGSQQGIEYAIVSDGCSGRPSTEPGSPFTDWGARFIARAAQSYSGMGADEESRWTADMILHRADSARYRCNLPSCALDATLLWAVADKSKVTVRRSGDGVIAKKYRDGVVSVEWCEFGKNMPFYLSNLSSGARTHQYIELAKTVTFWSNLRRPGKGWGNRTSEEQALTKEHSMLYSVYPRAELETVILFSDGVETFEDQTRYPISLEYVVDQVIGFKSYTGKFVTRRCSKMLHEMPWKHYDDFSCAAIFLGGEA